MAVYLAGLAAWASAQGYTRYSRYRQILLGACFSRWRRVSSSQVACYLRSRTRRVRRHRGDAAALMQFVRFLRGQGVVPAERIRPRRQTPVGGVVDAFDAYLRHERALALMTIVNYVPIIHRFLEARFGTGPVTLSRLSARDVVGFVQHEARRLHPKRAKVLTTALRSFLRFAQARGHIAQDLTGAVPPWPSGR